MTKIETVGWIELVDFPEFSLQKVEAKIDTGANSGALHATNIRVVKRGLDDKRILRFWPEGNEAKAQETDQFLMIYVRSATGHKVRRYVIDTTIRIHGHDFPIRIGLSDRSDMKRPVLLGRRFLRKNNIVVDVRINQELDDEGEIPK